MLTNRLPFRGAYSTIDLHESCVLGRNSKGSLVSALQEAANNGLLDKEHYVIPPHLHDLQEANLPETQHGLVISEFAQFRERAAKCEHGKLRDVRATVPNLSTATSSSGPKVRKWGKTQGTA